MELRVNSTRSAQVVPPRASLCQKCGKQLYEDLDGAACWSCGWHDYSLQRQRGVMRRDAELEADRLDSAGWRKAPAKGGTRTTARTRRLA